ncbi:WD repeat-containing protein 12 [Chytridiales sp. JEL 0842]|nr:WD repeat-containing protein 12 [Chytridiales sp. JEL 0842]
MVPSNLRRYGLSEIINHLLNLERSKPIPFDFIIDGKFLRTSLADYLESEGLSSENILDIEYVESLPPPTPDSSFDHEDWIAALDGSVSSSLVATACYDGKIGIWSTSKGNLAFLSGHESAVKTVRWLNQQGDSTMKLLSGGQDERILGWSFQADQKKGKVVFEGVGHEGSVDCLSVNKEGSKFASASADGTIKIWDASFDNLDESDAQQYESQGPSKRKRLQDAPVPIKRPISTLDSHVGAVSAVVFNKDSASSSTLYTGGWDHSVRVWDTATSSLTHAMGCDKVILSLDQSPLNGLLATSHTDPTLRLWDPRTASGLVVKLKLTSHTGWVPALSWSPSNPFCLVSCGHDSKLKVWDIRSRTPLHSSKVDKNGGKLLACQWFGGVVASGGEEGKLRMHVMGGYENGGSEE